MARIDNCNLVQKNRWRERHRQTDRQKDTGNVLNVEGRSDIDGVCMTKRERERERERE